MLKQVHHSEDLGSDQSKVNIKNCCEAIINQVCHDYSTGSSHKFKLFNQKPATSKSDIQRIIRQKKFLMFALNKSSAYQQPPMPLKIKAKMPEKRCYGQDDQQLREKAQGFITRIQSEKRELEGKVCLLKQEEKRRHLYNLKKIQIQQNIQREMTRKIRKLKAQKNIKYYNEKKIKYIKDASTSLSPQKRKLSELSDEDMIMSREYAKSPSPHASSLQQIMQEETETLPLGVRQQDAQNKKYDHQDDPGGFKLHQIKVSRHLKRQKSNKVKREIKKHYIISKNPTIDYSQYIEKYTNYEELEQFLTPKQTASERINPANRSRTISTPVRNTSLLQKSILNNSGGQEDELQRIKRRVQRQIQTEEIRTSSYFPFLNQAKKLKKRCHTLSDAK